MEKDNWPSQPEPEQQGLSVLLILLFVVVISGLLFGLYYLSCGARAAECLH